MTETTDVEALIYQQRALIHERLLTRGWILRYEGLDGAGCLDYPKRGYRLIHSVALEQDGHVWSHYSMSRRDRVMPTWEQVRDLFHDAAGDDALGIVVIPPIGEHYSIAEVAHVFACLTRRPIPDFKQGGATL